MHCFVGLTPPNVPLVCRKCKNRGSEARAPSPFRTDPGHGRTPSGKRAAPERAAPIPQESDATCRNAMIPFRREPQRPRRAPSHERDEGRHPEVPSFACATCAAAARNRDTTRRRAAAAAAGRQSPNSLRMASTASSRSQPKNSTSRSTSLPCSRKVTVFV